MKYRTTKGTTILDYNRKTADRDDGSCQKPRYIPNTGAATSRNAHCISLKSAYSDDDLNDYAYITYEKTADQETVGVDANEAYGVQIGADSHNNYEYLATSGDNFPELKTPSDCTAPEVFSANQAYGVGSRKNAQHDITMTSDHTPRKRLTSTSIDASAVFSTGNTEEVYADIDDAIKSSVPAAESHQNEAYGVRDDVTTFSSNQAYEASTTQGIEHYECVADAVSSATNKGGTEVLDIPGDPLVFSSNQAYELNMAEEEHYVAILDTIQSVSYRAVAASSQAHGTKITDSNEENQYELIPAENNYDTVGPNAAVVM
jgi:hypothetical protein